MSITLKEVAKACGVSITAVSLVLNDQPNRISPDVKKRIFQTAKELHYRPNQIAVSMVTKKTKSIGLIIPDINNLYFSELAKVIEQKAYAYGYHVMYGNTSDSVEQTFDYFNFFYNRGVDGIIVIYSNRLDEQDQERLKEMIQKLDIPVTLLDRYLSTKGTPSILVNHRKGGYLATKHLLELGHRRIGCITGPKFTMSSNERLRGYQDALQEAGINYREEFVAPGDFQVQSGRDALDSLLKQHVTAIFSFNDMMAIGLYRECKLRHIEVPRQLSIIGYDDIFLSELLDPPLTTIFQPINELGEMAVKFMIERILHNTLDDREILLEPELRIRESTATLENIV